jgi:hypothetical protein
MSLVLKSATFEKNRENVDVCRSLPLELSKSMNIANLPMTPIITLTQHHFWALWYNTRALPSSTDRQWGELLKPENLSCQDPEVSESSFPHRNPHQSNMIGLSANFSIKFYAVEHLTGCAT